MYSNFLQRLDRENKAKASLRQIAMRMLWDQLVTLVNRLCAALQNRTWMWSGLVLSKYSARGCRAWYQHQSSEGAIIAHCKFLDTVLAVIFPQCIAIYWITVRFEQLNFGYCGGKWNFTHQHVTNSILSPGLLTKVLDIFAGIGFCFLRVPLRSPLDR